MLLLLLPLLLLLLVLVRSLERNSCFCILCTIYTVRTAAARHLATAAAAAAGLPRSECDKQHPSKDEQPTCQREQSQLLTKHKGTLHTAQQIAEKGQSPVSTSHKASHTLDSPASSCSALNWTHLNIALSSCLYSSLWQIPRAEQPS
jgi:hypothetical protein